MINPKIFIYLFWLFFCHSSIANSTVELQGVNYPVWVIQNNQKLTLPPGTKLHNGDILVTGNHGRAWISLPDGSIFKLGQNTAFEINSVNFIPLQDSSLLDAKLTVLKGAFRFTTEDIDTGLNPDHKVSIKLGTLTTEIISKDVWGRTTGKEDFITLFNGSIIIQAVDQGITVLSQPYTVYRKLKDLPAEPQVTLEKKQADKLTSETELSVEQGVVKSDGKFDLILLSSKHRKLAEKEIEPLIAAGYAVQIESKVIHETVFNRAVLTGLNDWQSANNMLYQLSEKFGLKNIWIRNR